MTALTLEQKEQRLLTILRTYRQVALAFSGGVDSTLLLAVALEALGPSNVLAILADTPVVPRAELAQAQRLCTTLGATLVVVPVADPLDAAYHANTPERCYVCKKNIFKHIMQVAQGQGYAQVVEGSNVDDEGDYRPGRRALRELAIASPLLAAGLTKSEIRELSTRRQLPTANKPALSCLATRIPFGTPLTPEVLQQIERAEAALWQFGFTQCRVRHHGTLARIEVPVAEIARFLEPAVREHLVSALRDCGYTYVTLDLAGYRMGSFNPIAVQTKSCGEHTAQE